MIWPGRLARPVAYRRITPFRTSCGPPNPVAGAGCGGHDRVCPALSAARRSRSSSWQRIATLRRWGHRNILTGAIMELSLILSQAVSLQGVSVVPSPTPTRWTVHLERPTACHRITPFRTSCGRPDPVAGAVCRAMIGCVRHCRGDDAHSRAAGQP